MNHPIDPDPETDLSESSKHLKLLETLIDKILKRLEDDSCQPKIRDALIAIQLRQKLSEAKSVGAVETSEAEKFFWDEIEAIRQEELPKLYPEPTSLEAQIQATILSLKDLVKNGILSVKTVADAFNQSRYKQARLTYRRMGRLLSDMGFTKAKTPNGYSAIIWDDKLLPQYTFSDAQDFDTHEDWKKIKMSYRKPRKSRKPSIAWVQRKPFLLSPLGRRRPVWED